LTYKEALHFHFLQDLGSPLDYYTTPGGDTVDDSDHEVDYNDGVNDEAGASIDGGGYSDDDGKSEMRGLSPWKELMEAARDLVSYGSLRRAIDLRCI
jgi:hypothetical protein